MKFTVAETLRWRVAAVVATSARYKPCARVFWVLLHHARMELKAPRIALDTLLHTQHQRPSTLTPFQVVTVLAAQTAKTTWTAS